MKSDWQDMGPSAIHFGVSLVHLTCWKHQMASCHRCTIKVSSKFLNYQDDVMLNASGRKTFPRSESFHKTHSPRCKVKGHCTLKALAGVARQAVPWSWTKVLNCCCGIDSCSLKTKLSSSLLDTALLTSSGQRRELQAFPSCSLCVLSRPLLLLQQAYS